MSQLTHLALPAARIFKLHGRKGTAGVSEERTAPWTAPFAPQPEAIQVLTPRIYLFTLVRCHSTPEKGPGKEGMNEQDFLAMVKKSGSYESQGEASRAAHAVFGTVKSWLTPSASDMVRKALPYDAAQLWQYSPVAYGGGLRAVPGYGEESLQSVHFILKVQQLGDYGSSGEARRATCSVFSAFVKALSIEPGRFLTKVFPMEIMGACRAGSGWAA
ncbi:MAG: DUF2267 domain-containing protein [Thermoleophilia bacterium]